MASTKRFVVGIANSGYEVSLERRKVHKTRRDLSAAKRSLLRVIDESGEDHPYPEAMFAAIELSRPLSSRCTGSGIRGRSSGLPSATAELQC